MSLQQFWDQILCPKERYRLTGTLIGHRAPINCLIFLEYGVLASGGDDETVRIWDLNTEKMIQTFDDPGNRWGQITCMVASDAGGTMLFCGTGRGQVVIFKRSKRKNDFHKTSATQVFDADSVESIAYDPVNRRLACTSHNGKIKLNQFEREGNLEKLWICDSPGGSIPRVVLFGGEGKEVKVYCLETGELVVRDCETATKIKSHRLQSPIGNLDVFEKNNSLVIDNMTSGYDLYPIDRTSPTRTFEIPNSRRYVKMVKFAEKGAVIVGGSDHGCVYVFNISNSDPIQVLYHEKADSMIQAIATTSSNVENMIASGSSDGRFDICLWRKPSKQAAARAGGAWQMLWELVQATAVVLIVSLLYMGWATWAPIVAKGLESVPNIVQDGIRGPQERIPHTQRRKYSTEPPAVSEIGRGRVEMSHRAVLRAASEVGQRGMEELQNAGVKRQPRQLKDREHDEPANTIWKGLQVHDEIKDFQASTLLAEVESTVDEV